MIPHSKVKERKATFQNHWHSSDLTGQVRITAGVAKCIEKVSMSHYILCAKRKKN
jgi:hypothetical protein